MLWLGRFGYRIDLRRLGIAALLLALALVAARMVLRDSLTLGYVMMVPAYVFVAVVIEGARTVSGNFWDIRGWAETTVAIAGAAGVGYLGFGRWSIGY